LATIASRIATPRIGRWIATAISKASTSPSFSRVGEEVAASAATRSISTTSWAQVVLPIA
jgi:hypothetical protein